MPELSAVSVERHGHYHWQRPGSWAFARDRALVSLLGGELARACSAFPIAFTHDSAGYTPVAVLGLEPARNLYVAADGSWLVGYIPRALRNAPFAIATLEDGTRALCVDEALGLAADGEAFFDSDGHKTDALEKVVEELRAQERNRAATQRACAELAALEMIEPWPAEVDTANGRLRLEGLYRASEPALKALSPEALRRLRDAGALSLAYCQMISAQHLPTLGRLADAHANLAEKHRDGEAADIDLESLFEDDDDIFRFQ